MVKVGIVLMLAAGCGDNLGLPDAAPLPTCAELYAGAVDRPDIGECMIDGVDLLVTGVSYRSADGLHTWVQSVREYQGETGQIVRLSPWNPACYWRRCLVERTPATGIP